MAPRTFLGPPKTPSSDGLISNGAVSPSLPLGAPGPVKCIALDELGSYATIWESDEGDVTTPMSEPSRGFRTWAMYCGPEENELALSEGSEEADVRAFRPETVSEQATIATD